MRFWLYDIEYDTNQLFEKKQYQYFYQGIYVIMLTYTIVYAVFGQTENKLTNSAEIINQAFYFYLIFFGIFSLLLLILSQIRKDKVKLFRTVSRKDTRKRTFKNQTQVHPQNDLSGLPLNNQQQQNTISNNDKSLKELNNLQNLAHKRKQSVYQKQAEQGLFHKKLNLNISTIEKRKTYVLKTNIWTLVCITTIICHAYILLVMVIRFPQQQTHWIVFGINMFNMVTGHIFTVILGCNIIYNLIFSEEFFIDCCQENKLQIIMVRLYAQTGSFNFFLMGLSLIWGSLYSGVIEQDVFSLLVLGLLSTGVSCYWIYNKCCKSQQSS